MRGKVRPLAIDHRRISLLSEPGKLSAPVRNRVRAVRMMDRVHHGPNAVDGPALHNCQRRRHSGICATGNCSSGTVQLRTGTIDPQEVRRQATNVLRERVHADDAAPALSLYTSPATVVPASPARVRARLIEDVENNLRVMLVNMRDNLPEPLGSSRRHWRIRRVPLVVVIDHHDKAKGLSVSNLRPQRSQETRVVHVLLAHLQTNGIHTPCDRGVDLGDVAAGERGPVGVLKSGDSGAERQIEPAVRLEDPCALLSERPDCPTARGSVSAGAWNTERKQADRNGYHEPHDSRHGTSCG